MATPVGNNRESKGDSNSISKEKDENNRSAACEEKVAFRDPLMTGLDRESDDDGDGVSY